MAQLTLEIITQEKPVFEGQADAITAPATEGEITILPGHIPLFTKLNPGELKILNNNKWQVLAVAGGFMDISAKSVVTILADSAVRVEEINIAKAETAKRRAEENLKKQLSEHEFSLASADLRRVIFELKVARKHRRRTQLPS